jgi:hypothetical protein
MSIKPLFDSSASAPTRPSRVNQEQSMARKRFVAANAMREQVRSLAARGVRQDDIAAIIGCDAKTARKYFREELDRGMAEANANVTGALYEKAMGGDTAAQIFWVKARAHWREKEPEKPIPSSDAEQISHNVITLPDNNRDPELTEELRKTQEKYYARKQRRQARRPKKMFGSDAE